MEVFIGTIQSFAFNFAPQYWALCNGQTLTISQHNALFALIGNTYGGSFPQSFNLPDLRGRLLIGQGTGPGLSPRSMGQSNGTERVVATQDNLPNHTHDTSGMQVTTSVKLASVASNAQTTPDASHAFLGASASTGPSSAGIYSDQQGAGAVNMQGVGSSITGNILSTGGGQPMETMNPFLAINFSIALDGIFPPRD